MNKVKLQTVYLKSNGYHDWKVVSYNDDLIDHVEQKEAIVFTKEEYNQHIKEVIEEALRCAVDKAEVKEEFGNIYDPESKYFVVDKDSILNAYPLENIN